MTDDNDGIEIFCGDSLEVLSAMSNEIDLVFGDIPYPGMTIHDGSTKKLSDKGWFQEFGDLAFFVEQALTKTGVMAILLNSKESVRFRYEFVNHVQKTTGMVLVDEIMWLKPSIIPGRAGKGTSKFRQAFDPVLIFAKNPKDFTFNAVNIDGEDMREMNGYSRMHVNIFRGMSGKDADYVQAKKDTDSDHKGRCPEKLVQYLVSMYTNELDYVCDPFLGSGTTAAACKRLNRDCLGIDINPDNIKLAKAYVRSVK